MNENATTDKNFANQQADSRTKVYFPVVGVAEYCSGERLPITIRIDSGVYKQFKPNAKRVYGSVCKSVEGFMIAVNELVEKNVYFSHTTKPITIEKIVIERNIAKERRNLRVSDGVECKALDAGKCVVCGGDAYARAVDVNGSRLLCRADFLKLRDKLLGWKVLTP